MPYRKKGTVEASVAAALTAKPPADSDRAVADLALTYARQIDDEGDLVKLGPALLASLEALQMSPRARAIVHGRGVSADGKPAAPKPLDELRDRRAGKNRTASVDAAAPRSV
jgi:hypothetical protein